MRIYRWLVLLALMCAGGASAADVLLVAFDGASVPIMYVGPHGEPRGIYPAIVAAACAKIGQPVRIEVVPFRRAMAGLDAGSWAGGSVAITPERARMNVFSKPYASEPVAVYFRAGREPPARSIDGLRGLRIGVIRGWSYGAQFDGARAKGLFTVEEVDSDLANFRKLALGRLDAVVATTVAGELLRRDSAFASQVAVGYTLMTVPIHLALNKSDPHRALLPKFDEAIDQMRKSGELAAITATAVEQAAHQKAGAAAKP